VVKIILEMGAELNCATPRRVVRGNLKEITIRAEFE